MLGLWIWSILVALLCVWTVFHAVFGANPLAVILMAVWVILWAVASVRAVERQSLRPRWYWVIVGSLGGILMMVPIWHHGREFKSRWDKVISWLALVLLLAFWVAQSFKPVDD